MDARRGIIRDLTERRRENLLFRERTLEDLGKSLAERLSEDALPGAQGDDYRRFKREIADSEASIGVIQGSLKRVRELNEEIDVKRFEKKDRQEEAAILYEKLGRRVLEGEDGEPPAELRAYKRQHGSLLDRAASLQEKLRDLDYPREGGFLSWLRRVVQGMVIRSSLKRVGWEVNQVCRQAGEVYARALKSPAAEFAPTGDLAAIPAADSAAGGLGPLIRDTLSMLQILADLDEAIAVLEREKAKIQGSFGFKEGPQRRIKTLEELAGKRRRDLRELCYKVGEAAGSLLTDSLEEADRAALEKAQRYGDSAAENGREIERIEAEIAIDRERDRIAKLERAVYSQKSRAADSEKNIAELNRKIGEASKRIEDLKGRSGNG
ncbi:MAG: hypothetical protein LBG84_04780 [Treponema sp.]|jgi:hypothetical protein|nr:hypothetical protein [Treponema sp.]